jgi:hypothetical protein
MRPKIPPVNKELDKGVDVGELDISLYFNRPSRDGISDRNFIKVAAGAGETVRLEASDLIWLPSL